ncbi:MAG: hypothetical protein LBV12_05345 [Puniceicoccales bacterium]|jgi:hypothetical protein|nr:hypothetical protein [Puniceicoccales bacterium]
MKLISDCIGGNFKLSEVSGSTIRGCQEIRDTTEWWFHWRFQLGELVPGERWRVEFTDGEVVGLFGPAAKFGGAPWSYLGKASRLSGSAFEFDVPSDCHSAEFAFSVPYDPSDWQTFCESYKHLPFLLTGILCHTPKDRDVPFLQIGREDAHGMMVLTARHHACETTGNYLLEGILENFLSRDIPLLYPVLQRYKLFVVPFMDMDGVVDGDQGKSRRPHDHNRDYTDNPIYASVAALQEAVRNQRDLIALDCHSPDKWGGCHNHALLVRPDNPEAAAKVALFGQELRNTCRGQSPEQCLLYDQLWDKRLQTDWDCNYLTDSQLGELRGRVSTNCSNYMVRQGARLACSVEIPYFGTTGNPSNPDNIRSLGRLLGLSLEHYIMCVED